jgi:uncharacterized protein YidB (DUF937 family)
MVAPGSRTQIAGLRVCADLCVGVDKHNRPAAPIGGCVLIFPEESKMGLLDEVIGAALGSRGQPAPGQTAQGQPNQDQFAQIAAALMALLAPRQAAAPAGQPGAGPAAQQASPGGLDVLINQFKQSGFEDVINSWIGTGQNEPISPNQLRDALGQKTVNDLSRQAGAPQDDLLSQLSRYLPGVIDRLTPNGQLPKQADLRSGF